MLRPARPEDAAALAPRLRASDRAEIAALAGIAPVVALQSTLGGSTRAFAMGFDGERVDALFGYRAPAGLGLGALVWAMGSDALPENRKLCIRVAKDFLSAVGREHGSMTNIVDARNTPSIRLLRRLGFTVSGQPLPAAGGGTALAFWRRD